MWLVLLAALSAARAGESRNCSPKTEEVVVEKTINFGVESPFVVLSPVVIAPPAPKPAAKKIAPRPTPGTTTTTTVTKEVTTIPPVPPATRVILPQPPSAATQQIVTAPPINKRDERNKRLTRGVVGGALIVGTAAVIAGALIAPRDVEVTVHH
jgi:hypothetical protein